MAFDKYDYFRVGLFWVSVPFLVLFAAVVRLHRKLKPRPALWYPFALFIGLPFLILDTLYNWTIGSLVWWELPREYLYTTRLKRKKKEGQPEAFHQCDILNKHDPGHC